MFLSPIIYEKIGPRRWRLHADLVYEASDGAIYTVPKGTETDCASIPRIFWVIIPPVGAYDGPAILHDWLYLTGVLSRKDADRLFLEAMIDCEVKEWTRTKMYYAVRIGGWKPWNDYRSNITN